MRTEPYSREPIDAKFEALKHELRTDMAQMKSELKGDIAAVRSEVSGLRGELKVWLLVIALVVTPIMTGIGSRVSTLLWPPPGGNSSSIK